MFAALRLSGDRDPCEAWIWAQRICGVCTSAHAMASSAR